LCSVLTNVFINSVLSKSRIKIQSMKKFFLISLLISSLFSFSNAQFSRIGGGIALSSGFPFHNMQYEENKSGIIALSFKGIFELKAPLEISPSFTIFYPHITQLLSSKTTVTTFMFDINGHYVFSHLEKFEPYGLAGLNMLFAQKKESTGLTVFKESDNPIGINLGIGTYLKLTDKLEFFGEVKYIFSKYDQFMANGGILLEIDWLKKKG
jgi:hypothetical protein